MSRPRRTRIQSALGLPALLAGALLGSAGCRAPAAVAPAPQQRALLTGPAPELLPLAPHEVVAAQPTIPSRMETPRESPAPASAPRAEPSFLPALRRPSAPLALRPPPPPASPLLEELRPTPWSRSVKRLGAAPSGPQPFWSGAQLDHFRTDPLPRSVFEQLDARVHLHAGCDWFLGSPWYFGCEARTLVVETLPFGQYELDGGAFALRLGFAF